MLKMLRSRNRVVWTTVTTAVALVLFLSTPQTDISRGHHAYATDVEVYTLAVTSTMATLILAIRFSREENARNLTLLPSRDDKDSWEQPFQRDEARCGRVTKSPSIL